MRREWALIAGFIAFDIAVVGLGRKYLFHELESHPVARLPVAEETKVVEELGRLAQGGSWEQLESSRRKHLMEFEAAHRAPDPGVAMYFFPEILPARSLARDFSEQELRPALDSLRQAYERRRPPQARRAFERLESRVQNFELGAVTQTEMLSPEAMSFLQTYRPFSEVN